MCTAIRYENFFGRNLDIWTHYGEEPTVTGKGRVGNIYAMAGMAKTVSGYPLYFDAMNEKGLAMAALNFPGYCVYHHIKDNVINLPSYELIPHILGNCKDIAEAKAMLEKISITELGFSKDLPPTPLHWMIADKGGSVVAESVADGLKIYEDPIDVLTNSPDFEMQRFNLNNYISLSSHEPEHRFPLPLHRYSLGMGALGLPGDLSSMSRFVRAAFHLHHSQKGLGMTHLFTLLSTVAMPKGSVMTPEGRCEYTHYSCCCDLYTKKYYYTKYDDRNIRYIEL